MENSILDARERRFQKKLALTKHSGLPVVSITINVPFGSRNKPPYIMFHHNMANAFRQKLKEQGIGLGELSLHVDEDGPSAIFTVDMDPLPLKKLCVAYEEQTSQGRLLDIDVLTDELGLIDRKRVLAPPRTCIICGGELHACIVGKKHPQDILMKKIEELLYDVPQDSTLF